MIKTVYPLPFVRHLSHYPTLTGLLWAFLFRLPRRPWILPHLAKEMVKSLTLC